jgi:N-acetylmuramoyl-L-alanine amidase
MNTLKTLRNFNLTACPTIISRSGWGARPPKGTPTRLPSPPVPYAVIHHGGSNAYCTTESRCAAIIRSYQNYHLDTQGWNDIGYNFVVGEDGNVYEGRGWDNVGAHEPAYSKSIGICIIGDFTGGPAAMFKCNTNI